VCVTVPVSEFSFIHFRVLILHNSISSSFSSHTSIQTNYKLLLLMIYFIVLTSFVSVTTISIILGPNFCFRNKHMYENSF
jgi:hypothetical protein